MDFGELIKPCLGLALKGVQFVPSGEEVPFFGLAELLGLLHLGLIVIPVLREDLDLNIVLLGEVGKFGPQLSGLGCRKKGRSAQASLPPRLISAMRIVYLSDPSPHPGGPRCAS